MNNPEGPNWLAKIRNKEKKKVLYGKEYGRTCKERRRELQSTLFSTTHLNPHLHKKK
jgi:hypothetical protein